MVRKITDLGAKKVRRANGASSEIQSSISNEGPVSTGRKLTRSYEREIVEPAPKDVRDQQA